jgi:2-oxoglutarate ferredoxin oxidoreductase subunit gamma
MLNSSLFDAAEENETNVLRVPASEIADELGNIRVANTVMLGAYNQVRRITTLENLQRALDYHLSGGKSALRQVNYRALQRGASFAAEKDPGPRGSG